MTAPRPSVTPSRPMFDTLCALPLTAELFSQAVHPTEPFVAAGLSSGHVSVLRLPSMEEEAVSGNPARSRLQSQQRRGSNGTGVIEAAWRTRRHKGSCRCLSYGVDGRQLFSAGTDGIVKAADAETGKVIGKVAIPSDASSLRDLIDSPSVIHALSPQTLLLATDSSALHLYDLRDPGPSLPLDSDKLAFVSGKPAQTHHPHTDFISSLFPVPPSATSTSGFSKQWLSTGGTTLALTDLRRGVLVKSEDQEEILLSSLYITGLPVKKSSGSTGEKALIGGGDGVITLWEKGQWDDQDERITVSREKETLDSLAQIPDGVGGFGKKVAVGLGDGTIRFVRLGMNKVVGEVRHDEIEGVSELGFDAGGRMISGGGAIIKVWRESMAGDEDEGERDDSHGAALSNKRTVASDDSDYDQDDDSEVETSSRSRKKRKRGKGPVKPSLFSFTGLD